MSSLRRQIRTYLGDNKSSAHTVIGDGVSRAFLQAMVALIGTFYILLLVCYMVWFYGVFNFQRLTRACINEFYWKFMLYLYDCLSWARCIWSGRCHYHLKTPSSLLVEIQNGFTSPIRAYPGFPRKKVGVCCYFCFILRMTNGTLQVDIAMHCALSRDSG